MTTPLDLHDLRTYCADKHGAETDYPFGPETLVYKVGGRMFALIALDRKDEPPTISLKCDPVLAEMLRTIYDAVQPGYHLNKQHWNTIIVDGSITNGEILEMIDNSYNLVIKSLKKAEREKLQQNG